MVDGAPDKDPEERIADFSRDIAPYAQTVVAIEDDQTDGTFAEFFAGLRSKRKEIEDWFETIKEPLNKALRRLNSKQKELCDPLRLLEDKITQARSLWLDKKRTAAEAEAKQLSDQSGGGVSVLPAQPPRTIATAAGDITIRKQKSWRLTDDHDMTARWIAAQKIQLTRADPRLRSVPDDAFVLQASLVVALLKTGHMPEGEHSIEVHEEAVSQFTEAAP